MQTKMMNKEDILKEIESIHLKLQQLDEIIAEDIGGGCCISLANDAIHQQFLLDQRLYQLEQLLKEGMNSNE